MSDLDEDIAGLENSIAKMTIEQRVLEIWRVLNLLTVSLDHLGSYEIFHGTDTAMREVHRWMSADSMSPPLAERIAKARAFAESLLEEQNPEKYSRRSDDEIDTLEELGEHEKDYWDGPV